MNICYHGTNEENARSILKQGFRPETFFARNLQQQVGTRGRGNKIRTYNFKRNRCKDHIFGKKVNLQEIMRGNFQIIWQEPGE